MGHIQRILLSSRSFLSRSTIRYLSTVNTANILDHDLSDVKSLTELVLNVTPISPNVFKSDRLLKGRKSLDAPYGGQILSHAIHAGSSTVDNSFFVHSLHSYFIKSGSVDRPIFYVVERIRDGRSFCTRYVKAIQDEAIIFTAQMSFHKREPDSISHQCEFPKNLTPPESLPDGRELMEEAIKDESKALSPLHHKALKVRMRELPPLFHGILQTKLLQPEIWTFREPAPKDEVPQYHVWVKATETLGENFSLQRSLAAFISDSSMMEAALIPHVSHGFIPSMVYSLDHCIYFHEPEFRIDEWMYYETYSTKSGGSRAYTNSRLWTRDGRLVLSANQEGIIRART